MTQYVEFDSSVADPKPTLGWYDTGLVSYPQLPASEFLLEVTPVQWAQHTADPRMGAFTVVAGGLVYDAGWQPPPPPPTPAQKGAAALASFIGAGLVVTSAGTPELNGTYSITGDAQANIASEAQFVSTFNEFTNGATTNMPWVLQNGSIVEWPTTTEFMAFAKALAQLVSAAKIAAAQIAAGQSVSMPSNAVTIP